MATTNSLINEYLDRLDAAARALPASRRLELVAEIKEHISVTLAESGSGGETHVRTILDRLGEPEDIVREASDEPSHRGGQAPIDIVTVLLLLIGGVVLPVLGWLVGAVLLWASERWVARDKLIGTFLIPGGLGPAVYLLFAGANETGGCDSSGVCRADGGTPTWLLASGLIVTLIVPVVVALYLTRRAARVR